MSAHRYLAVDLGAESGRVMLGTLSKGKLKLEEIHRFPNGPVEMRGTLRWDLPRLWQEIREGLRKAGALKLPIHSVSADSWGVSYAYFNRKEPLLSLPFHYRDPRTDNAFKPAFARASRQLIYQETGIQFMTINTLYQLRQDLLNFPELLEKGRFLMIADYFHYLMCGRVAQEVSMASTTQLYNPQTRAWSKILLQKLGLPATAFPPVVPSGRVLGPLERALSEETGLKGIQVTASCSHDTGAAVAAVPARGSDWAYLSSGTWSLLGIESPRPIINARARDLGFTNEQGFAGTTRFLKNIVGLFILQECRREWERQGLRLDYDAITARAARAKPLASLINPGDPLFSKPGGMPEKIRRFCLRTGQPAPSGPGQTARCVLESLALLYRHTLDELARASGAAPEVLHIVGGGSKNRLLNQLSADATGLEVAAGPAEATAMGNVLVQAAAMKHLKGLKEIREVVRNSARVEIFKPGRAVGPRQAWPRFLKLLKA